MAYDFDHVFTPSKEKETQLQQGLNTPFTNQNYDTTLRFEEMDSSKLAQPEIEKVPTFNQEDVSQRQLRGQIAMQFMQYMKPEVQGNWSFKLSRADFKVAMILPSLLAVIPSFFFSGFALLAATILMPFFIYLQLSDTAQANIFERSIWKKIENLPEDKLQQTIHSLLSNDLISEEYSEEEIKSIIYDFIYSKDSTHKMIARHKIKEAMMDINKQMKKIIYKNV